MAFREARGMQFVDEVWSFVFSARKYDDDDIRGWEVAVSSKSRYFSDFFPPTTPWFFVAPFSLGTPIPVRVTPSRFDYFSPFGLPCKFQSLI